MQSAPSLPRLRCSATRFFGLLYPLLPLRPFVQTGFESLPRTRLIVGVSGGRDSTFLLHALAATGRKNLVVAHLNHSLRGRVGNSDASFVKRLAARLHLPLCAGRADTRTYARERGVSIELAARELRHTFFAAAARAHRTNDIVLAHHADDQIETILHNFLRGSGPTGLTGMKPRSTLTIGRRQLQLHRPLLTIRRDEINHEVSAQRIAFREDASNADPAHTRNRLRHEILPQIESSFGPQFAEAALRNATILSAEDEHLGAETDAVPLTPELAVRLLQDLSLAIRRRVIRRWLQHHEIATPTLTEVDRVLSLISPSGPAKVNLPADRHARRRSGKLFLE